MNGFPGGYQRIYEEEEKKKKKHNNNKNSGQSGMLLSG
jgi:hypothetical protein